MSTSDEERVRRLIVKHVDQLRITTRSTLRRALTARDRGIFDQALDAAVTAGEVGGRERARVWARGVRPQEGRVKLFVDAGLIKRLNSAARHPVVQPSLNPDGLTDGELVELILRQQVERVEREIGVWTT